MDHEDRTDRRNAAIEAGRLLADGDVGAAERCHPCGELLHPYPEPEYWMQYPLPGCGVVDGLRFCDDDRKPECIDSHLVKHPKPAAPAAVKTKNCAKKAGGVEERLRERDEAAADLAAELPEERAGVRCLVEVGDGFGSLLDLHFAFHVVDLDGPFISETDYRSHFETAQGGMTVDQVAAAVFAGYLKAHRRYLTAEAAQQACRQAGAPLAGWHGATAQAGAGHRAGGSR